MSIPYVGFGNDQLTEQPDCRQGDMVECPHCNHAHPVQFATSQETGQKTNLLGFYHCGEKTYLACLAGKFVTGLTPGCSGRI